MECRTNACLLAFFPLEEPETILESKISHLYKPCEPSQEVYTLNLAGEVGGTGLQTLTEKFNIPAQARKY